MLPQEKSHYLILCQDPGGSLTSELLTPPPGGWPLAHACCQPPSEVLSFTKMFFHCSCLPEKYHSPRPEGIQVLGMTWCPELKLALSLPVQELGMVESVWIEQRNREEQCLQVVLWLTKRSPVIYFLFTSWCWFDVNF